MNYKSHRIAGLCSGLVVGSLITKGATDNVTLEIMGLITSASIIGSLLPDIDHPESKISKNAQILSKGINMVAGHRGVFHSPLLYIIVFSFLYILIGKIPVSDNANFITKIMLIIICSFYGILKEKPILLLYSVFGISLFFIPNSDINVYLLLLNTLIGLFTGVASHLLLDMMTVSGIPFLWPISKHKFRLLKLKTNKHEYIARILVVIPTFIFVFIRYKDFFKPLLIKIINLL